MATTSVSNKLPSLALKVTLYTPDWVKLGLKVNEPAPFPLSKNVALVGTLAAVKVGVVPFGSNVNEPAPLPLSKNVELVGTLAVLKVRGFPSISVACTLNVKLEFSATV